MSLPIKVKVQGHPLPLLVASTGICRCGDIKDGIGFHHASDEPFKSEGGWVISFADLERIYEAARLARSERGDAC